MAKSVLAYGETLWDLLPGGPQLGGAPFNFAYRVQSLRDLAHIVTRLGTDELGRRAADRIDELGMDTRFVQWDEEAPTGTVEVDLDDPNNPDFHIVPDVAYDHIEATDELRDAAAEADCLCFGTLVQRTETSRETLEELLAQAGGAVKLLDINLRRNCYNRHTVTVSLKHSDVLKLNDDEVAELDEMLELGTADVPEFARVMIEEWALTDCVVTFGERGAFAASAEGQQVYCPGYRVDLVDTCGSGDAFSAGFIHLLLRGHLLAECCELGNALGALVATKDGATAPISLDEVEAFLQQEHERIADPGLSGYPGR
ncbi:MAG: carbohydrate kinase [Candidatus Brocadiia bacterium]